MGAGELEGADRLPAGDRVTDLHGGRYRLVGRAGGAVVDHHDAPTGQRTREGDAAAERCVHRLADASRRGPRLDDPHPRSSRAGRRRGPRAASAARATPRPGPGPRACRPRRPAAPGRQARPAPWQRRPAAGARGPGPGRGVVRSCVQAPGRRGRSPGLGRAAVEGACRTGCCGRSAVLSRIGRSSPAGLPWAEQFLTELTSHVRRPRRLPSPADDHPWATILGPGLTAGWGRAQTSGPPATAGGDN